MAGTAYDFAIVGSTPIAGLLARYLATAHGKQVIQVKRTLSPQRLIRGIDLALPLAVRPQSWKIVADSRVGGLHANVTVHADTEATVAALDHIAHVAMGFGLAGERAAQPGGSVAFSFRRVPMLAESVSPTPDAQLADMADVSLDFTRTGVAELWMKGEKLPATQIVLADDAAILDWLPEAHWPAGVSSQAMTATLTAPTRRLPGPIQLYPDRGVTVLQRPGDAVLGIVAGDEQVEARLASTLRGPFPISRVATSRYRRIVTADAAPVIGRLRPSRLFVVAGLGDASAYFAPALARQLAGAPEPHEKRWFAAHDPARTTRDAVAEFMP